MDGPANIGSAVEDEIRIPRHMHDGKKKTIDLRLIEHLFFLMLYHFVLLRKFK